MKQFNYYYDNDLSTIDNSKVLMCVRYVQNKQIFVQIIHGYVIIICVYHINQFPMVTLDQYPRIGKI